MASGKDGSRCWAFGELTPLSAADGVASGFVMILRDAGAARDVAEREGRFRQVFDVIDEGFCIIEFFDGPHGPSSDYVHVEANAAYARNAGIPDVVGQKVRKMVPDEADGWIELYGGVLATGTPIRFQRELVATGRYLELAAFRVEPASLRQVAVIFQDITARRRAELELRRLNETLEARVAEALAERRVLAEIVETTDAFVHVVDLDFRWIAINEAGAAEFERVFGQRPTIGDRMLDLLDGLPEARALVEAIWSRALAGEEFTAIGEFGDGPAGRRSYEMKFNTLRDEAGIGIGAFQVVTDITERVEEQRRLEEAEDRASNASRHPSPCRVFPPPLQGHADRRPVAGRFMSSSGRRRRDPTRAPRSSSSSPAHRFRSDLPFHERITAPRHARPAL